MFGFFDKFKSKKLKSKNISKFKKNLYLNKTFNRSLLLNENNNLFNLGKLSFPRLNKLLFSFNFFNKYRTLKFNFLKPYFNVRASILIKKLRTRNYYSIISRGRPYALINRLSFFNTFTYGGFLRRRIFKNWVKFSIYFEKLNYLIVLNNEDISNGLSHSQHFFYSLYFPFIFNFRNLFFNLLKFFKHLKYVNDKLIFKNFKFFSSKKKQFNKRFFGVLLNFLLNNKKFSKTPKNLLLNSSSFNYKINFSSLNYSNFNNLNLIKTIYLGLFSVFLENINYLHMGLKPNEKFTNDSLYKLSFVNFSLGFNHLFFVENQSSLSFNLESSKSLLHQK
jgi:hypothetical protein